MKLRIPLLALSALVLLSAGCAKKETAPAAGAASVIPASPTKITVQLDWIPEPEHGGLYQAQARGWFKEAGLEVTLVPGGSTSIPVNQLIASGKADLGQGESVTTLLDVHKGLPLLQVAAVFQNDPSVFLLHPESPVHDFKDLNGRKVTARPGWLFLDYLRQKYAIDFTVIPTNFSLANFIADKEAIQQGYYIAEPFYIAQGGAPAPRYLYAWDAGYDSYGVLIANPDWAKKNPAALRAFIAAYIRGWRDYLEGDPTPAHEAMKQANPKNTDAVLAFSRNMINEGTLVTGRDATDSSRIGRLDPARYATQLKIVEDLKLMPRSALKISDVMSPDYLPAKPAP